MGLPRERGMMTNKTSVRAVALGQNVLAAPIAGEPQTIAKMYRIGCLFPAAETLSRKFMASQQIGTDSR